MTRMCWSSVSSILSRICTDSGDLFGPFNSSASLFDPFNSSASYRSAVSDAAGQQVVVHNVFVYGSLMADDVVRSQVQHQRASLTSNPSRSQEERQLNGRVLMGITYPELDILDAFEDVEYERRDVEVAMVHLSQMLKAATYVWSDVSDPNLYGEWNLEAWKDKHKEDFIKMTAGFMAELKLPESKTAVDHVPES
ncbi:hypothetical protein SAY86_009306 [Trapa natans]|uniref:Putative gamma-glutamylcyclotransferase n=1 Tax=Trapa natans TaxID=22666 RepID=A0AAN7KWH3_TRANT|nr:hypothetical protein SAY86_009306 [Trapa natans]